MIVEFIKALIRFLTYLSILAILICVMMGITGFAFREVVLWLFGCILGSIIGILLCFVITWAFT